MFAVFHWPGRIPRRSPRCPLDPTSRGHPLGLGPGGRHVKGAAAAAVAASGRRTAALASQLDLFPTLASVGQAAGFLKQPGLELDGFDLSHVLFNASCVDHHHRDYLWCETWRCTSSLVRPSEMARASFKS